MKYWLLKTEPGTYSWQDLVRDKKTTWDGVRNYAARNNLAAMKKGDRALIYHSVSDKLIMGIAKVSKEAFPDPTAKKAEKDRWVAVNIQPLKVLKRPLSLAEVKAEKSLQEMQLVTNSRLSVQEVTKKEFEKIVEISQQFNLKK